MRWILTTPGMLDKAIATLQRTAITVPMCLEITEWKAKRNVEQNKRLWAIYTAISQQAPAHMDGQWYSPAAWHFELAGRFLGYTPTPNGEGMPKSTTRLSVSEMADYQTQIEAWAIEEFDLQLDAA